jgi:hypothetical protein
VSVPTAVTAVSEVPVGEATVGEAA